MDIPGTESWQRARLFGMPVDVGLRAEDALAQVANGSVSISYLNPFAWKVARTHPRYLEHLDAMSLVHCDSMLIQRALKHVNGWDTPIVSLDYSGIGRDVLELLEVSGASLCLVGGTENVLSRANARLRREFHELRLTGTFSGFGASVQEAREFVMDSRPNAVFIGMGMGLQEAFLVGLNRSGWRGVGICVGGLFERLADPTLEYPAWSERNNLRYLSNILRRPMRYGRRYFVDYFPFYRLLASGMVRGGSRRGEMQK